MSIKKIFIMLLAVMLLVTGCSAATTTNEEKPAKTEGSASASEYPTKPIQVIISFPPGGETDVVGRMILTYAQEYMGQNFVIINKPGASGEIGWSDLSRTEPDGYTIGMINPPTFVQLPIKRGEECLYKLDQFTPIANASTDPGAIVVLKDHKANSLKELVDLALANPGTITVATGGAGTSEALALRRISSETGSEFKEVPFDGTANMSAALQGGHVEVAVMNVSTAYELVRQGKAKVLGVGSLERSSKLPEVPTYIEQGINVEQFAMRGFAAPAGTDPEIIKKLSEAIQKAMENEEFKAKAEEASLILDYQNSEEFTKTLNYLYETNKKEWETNPW